MRPSTSLHLKLKPLPFRLLPSLRLPPAASTSPSKTSSKTQPTVADTLIIKAATEPEWPKNVRIEEFVSNKQLYWNVPKEQRDVLRKELREK